MTAVSVHLFDLDAPSPALARFWETLSDGERGRAAGFAGERSRARYVAAHGTLRLLLSRIVGAAPSALGFACNAHGKPYLAGSGAPHPLRFSLSHSGPRLAVAWTWGREVGIDIETVRSVESKALAETLAPFLTEKESRAPAAAPAARRGPTLLRLWVRAEARQKAAGLGFAARARGRFALRDLDLGPGLIGAVAAEGRGLKIRPAVAPELGGGFPAIIAPGHEAAAA